MRDRERYGTKRGHDSTWENEITKYNFRLEYILEYIFIFIHIFIFGKIVTRNQ